MPNPRTDGYTPAGLASPTFTTQITTPIIALTGGQIAFPAAQAASADANTLDDYEEGYWTASLTLGGGTATVNSSYDQLAYRKIGNKCYIQGGFYISAVSSPSGSVILNGLPFVTAALTEYADSSLVQCAFTGLTNALSGMPIGFIMSGESTVSLLDKVWDSTALAGDWGDHLDADCWIWISGSYITA